MRAVAPSIPSRVHQRGAHVLPHVSPLSLVDIRPTLICVKYCNIRCYELCTVLGAISTVEPSVYLNEV